MILMLFAIDLLCLLNYAAHGRFCAKDGSLYKPVNFTFTLKQYAVNFTLILMTDW